MADDLVILDGATSTPAESSDLVDLSAAPAEAAATPIAPPAEAAEVAEAAATEAQAPAVNISAKPDAPNKIYKNSGIADIIFLIDVTGSMQSCIDALRDNINKFIDMLTSTEGNGSPVTDWRARVVGYRDYNADGPTSYGWLVDNGFTRDVATLRNQLAALKAKGGGDVPESLLDAMMTVATTGAIDLQATGDEENTNKWRPIGTAARFVVVFTDADFHTTLSIPGYEDATLMDLINVYSQERIKPYFFMPAYEIAEALESFYGAICFKCPVPVSEDDLGLKVITEEPEVLNRLLTELAKGVSQHSQLQQQKL